MKKNLIETIKQHKILCISIVICVLVIILCASSYAYWKVSKKQSDYNDIVASCIDLTFADNGTATSVSLLNEVPIEDETALSDYDGYNFYVKNNCNQEVIFFIASEKITPDADSINNSSISMAIITDSETITSDYASLTSTDAVSSDAHSAKIIKYETLGANEQKEFNYKMWINSTSTIEDTEKNFESRLFITTYQGIVDPEYAMYSEGCFAINGNGTIVGYNVDATDLDGNACVYDQSELTSLNINGDTLEALESGELPSWSKIYAADVTIPETVAGINVTKVSGGLTYNLIKNDNHDYLSYIYYVKNDKSEDDICIEVTNFDDNYYDWYAKYYGFEDINDMYSSFVELGYEGELTDLKENIYDMANSDCKNNTRTTEKSLVATYDIIMDAPTALLINDLNLSNATYLEEIGDFAFSSYIGTNDLLTIPNTVTSIGNYAFSNYNGSNLTLNDNITNIGVDAFHDYVGTGQDLTLPANLTIVNEATFYKYKGGKINFGNKIEEIGHSAFYEYNQNEKLDLPDSLSSIGTYAFHSYVGTNQDLTIPNNIATIPYGAFSLFKGNKLTLSNSLISIDGYNFEWYVGTDQELVLPDSLTTLATNTFTSFNGSKITFGSGLESFSQYNFDSYVGTGQDLVLGENFTTIPKMAFSSFNGNNIVFNDKLISIGYGAFTEYEGIGIKLNLPSSLKTIEDYAFHSYFGDNQILEIPGSVTSIGSYAFSWFVGNKVILNEGLITISSGAFKNNSGDKCSQTASWTTHTHMYDLCISTGATRVNEIGFIGTNSTLTIPNTVTTIGDQAFELFNGTGLTLGTGLTSIGSASFYNYTGIINTNRTQTAWNDAISSGELDLWGGIDGSWRNASSTLTYLSE